MLLVGVLYTMARFNYVLVFRWSRVALGMFGKLFITTSFNAFYVWSVELYPTTVR